MPILNFAFDDRLFLVCVFSTLVLCGKFWSPCLSKAQQPQEQRYHFVSMCVECSCPNNGMAAKVWDF